ncbi:MAG: SMP-30/gluconolactonase/LRE family protein [Flavobacteriales bacterium]|nr:SMP-30/gluconolactonase/LRE family protein [Flavobacteriales bacterium]
MKIRYIIALLLLSMVAFAQQTHNVITVKDPSTVPLSKEEKGEVLNGVIKNSSIYPGTTRSFQVLVPKGYDGRTPACLVLGLDGNLFGAITVIDNLVKTGEMPMTIGVFLNPGVCYDDAGKVVRYNRSNEFDRTDDKLARFIESEVLPEVEKMKTADGRAILISKDANDRAITGASSSGIVAFTVAWERPDMFSRVYSSVGTFVAMRGGNEYPAIVRKTEPQRLRIFLQDGVNDTWNHIFGDWWEYNQLMSSALNYAGYEFDYKWDRGGHSIYYGTRIYPDVMRWLWRGYPAQVRVGESMNDMMKKLIKKDTHWKELCDVDDDARLFALGAEKVLVAQDVECKVMDTTGVVISSHKVQKGRRVIGVGVDDKIISADATGVYISSRKVAGVKNAHTAQQTHDGKLYISTTIGDMYMIDGGGKQHKMTTLSTSDVAFAISPDNRLMVTGEKNSDWLISYVIKESGEIEYGQEFYWLHNVNNHSHSAYGNIAYDTLGNVYAATPIGIQVCDHNGRVRAILPLKGRSVSSIAFSGKYIYAISGGKLYVREVLLEGYNAPQEKIDVKSQGAG